MIQLVQFPWSPFCIVQRRILEFSGTKFKIVNIPNGDRSLVWRLTRERYYGVPIIRDGKAVIFEVGDDSQVISKYLDDKLHLGLFPWHLEGVQGILWRYIENEIEGFCFKLNDIYWENMVPPNRPPQVPQAQRAQVWPGLHRTMACPTEKPVDCLEGKARAVRRNADV